MQPLQMNVLANDPHGVQGLETKKEDPDLNLAKKLIEEIKKVKTKPTDFDELAQSLQE